MDMPPALFHCGPCGVVLVALTAGWLPWRVPSSKDPDYKLWADGLHEQPAREAHSAWVLDAWAAPRRCWTLDIVCFRRGAKFKLLHMHRVKRQTGAQRVNLRWQGARRFEAHHLVRALNGEESWRRRVYAQLLLHEVQLLLEGGGRWRLLDAAFWA